MRVLIPSPLHSYTANRSKVEAGGETLEEVLRDLDRRFPGLRFRVVDEQDRLRPHIKVFVNGVQTADLSMPLTPKDEVALVQAFSGG